MGSGNSKKMKKKKKSSKRGGGRKRRQSSEHPVYAELLLSATDSPPKVRSHYENYPADMETGAGR